MDIEFHDRGLVQVKGADKPLHMYLASPVDQTTFEADLYFCKD